MTLALRRSHILLLLAAASVVGCATPPAPKPLPTPPPPPPPPSEPHVEMTPIPNPTPQREEPRRVHIAPAEPAPQKAPPPLPPPTPMNPLRAAQLRGAGLEQLNRGAVSKAIALLKEANQLDPGNVLIKHDLDRALRVAKTLRENH